MKKPSKTMPIKNKLSSLMDTYKIAFVFDDSLDKTDGVQQYVLTLGKWLSEHGHDVHYIVGETKRSDIPNVHSLAKNVNVRFNHNRMSIPLPVSRSEVKALLLREEFDILHVQVPYSPMLAGRVIAAAGPQTGVVGTFHIAPHSRFVHMANGLLRLISGKTIKRFDEMLSVSKVAQTFAWETFRVESSIVPNTLDLGSFYDAAPLKRYQQGLNIVFLGRLVERKGCHYLLKAIKRLNEIGSLPKGTRVLICGKGPMEAELKAFVATHNLKNIVHFTGFITEEDKPRYLAGADIAVYPSTGGESFGIVLLEAMAASRGVVLAGNNPGYASVVGSRQEVLFDPTSEEQLADKIQRYLDSAHQRIEAHNWQQQFVRRFDVSSVADEILVAYEEALHKRRS